MLETDVSPVTSVKLQHVFASVHASSQYTSRLCALSECRSKQAFVDRQQSSTAFSRARKQSCGVTFFCAVRSSVVRSSGVDGRKSSALVVQSFRGGCAGRVALFDAAGLHTGFASNQAPNNCRRLRGRYCNQHKRVSMLQLQLAPACVASAAEANSRASLTTRRFPSTSVSLPLTRHPLRHAGIADCCSSGSLL